MENLHKKELFKEDKNFFYARISKKPSFSLNNNYDLIELLASNENWSNGLIEIEKETIFDYLEENVEILKTEKKIIDIILKDIKEEDIIQYIII